MGTQVKHEPGESQFEAVKGKVTSTVDFRKAGIVSVGLSLGEK